MSLQFRPPAVSEDCLYLNVYSPAGTSRGDKLPVRPLSAVLTASAAASLLDSADGTSEGFSCCSRTDWTKSTFSGSGSFRGPDG